jgi:hypothetical protein
MLCYGSMPSAAKAGMNGWPKLESRKCGLNDLLWVNVTSDPLGAGREAAPTSLRLSHAGA